MSIRYFEDFVVGQSVELGTYQFTAESIIAFASAYDPQVFHVDPERARQSMYGGLIASGWHTSAVYMRLLVDALLGQAASLGSPGLDGVRWLKPVRPGDTLAARITVLDCRISNTRPDRGIVRSRGEMIDQHGELVMQLEAINFFARRPESVDR
jgi:acyl dehydratase